jgi:hypothetical protein
MSAKEVCEEERSIIRAVKTLSRWRTRLVGLSSSVIDAQGEAGRSAKMVEEDSIECKAGITHRQCPRLVYSVAQKRHVRWDEPVLPTSFKVGSPGRLEARGSFKRSSHVRASKGGKQRGCLQDRKPSDWQLGRVRSPRKCEGRTRDEIPGAGRTPEQTVWLRVEQNSGTKLHRKVCGMLLDREAKNRKALYIILNLIVLRERAQNPLRMKRDWNQGKF